MRYVATFPDGRTDTVNAGGVRLTHAVIGRNDGRWELADRGCVSQSVADMHCLELQLISDYADLCVVPLVAA